MSEPGQAWRSTEVERVDDGRYRAHLSDRFVLAMVPQGGVVAAVAARAMAAELGTDQPLRSMHCVFASPVPAGELQVEASAIRRGRSVSQAQATVRGPGAAAGLHAIAAFGGDRVGFAEFTELAPPPVAPPEACHPWRDGPPPGVDFEPHPVWPFWAEVVEGRAALGTPPWEERAPDAAAEVANWFRFDHPPIGPDGLLDPLGLLVLADVMPGSVFERVGPRERWFAPSVDLTVQILGHATPGWILAHSRAHHAGDGYASAEMALWDPRAAGGPRLVAWASQQMLFTQVG